MAHFVWNNRHHRFLENVDWSAAKSIWIGAPSWKFDCQAHLMAQCEWNDLTVCPIQTAWLLVVGFELLELERWTSTGEIKMPKNDDGLIEFRDKIEISTSAMSFGPKPLHPAWIIDRDRIISMVWLEASLVPILWRPATTFSEPRVDVSVKQWAALRTKIEICPEFIFKELTVRTHTSLIIEPPHSWLLPDCKNVKIRDFKRRKEV